jgi:hypothetical protein
VRGESGRRRKKGEVLTNREGTKRERERERQRGFLLLGKLVTKLPPVKEAQAHTLTREAHRHREGERSRERERDETERSRERDETETERESFFLLLGKGVVVAKLPPVEEAQAQVIGVKLFVHQQ